MSKDIQVHTISYSHIFIVVLWTRRMDMGGCSVGETVLNSYQGHISLFLPRSNFLTEFEALFRIEL